MPKERFQPEEVIGKLRNADVLFGRGMSCGYGRASFPRISTFRRLSHPAYPTAAPRQESGPSSYAIKACPLTSKVSAAATTGRIPLGIRTRGA